MKIRLQGLTEGEHIYKDDITYADVELDGEHFPSEINVEIMIDKRSGNYYIKIFSRTTGHFMCDRCLTMFDEDVTGALTVLYTEDEQLWADGEDEDLRMVPKGGDEIDLSQDIHDALLLTLPIKHICREDCKGLCAQCGADLNTETCSCSKDVIDPRWEVLKKLK